MSLPAASGYQLIHEFIHSLLAHNHNPLRHGGLQIQTKNGVANCYGRGVFETPKNLQGGFKLD